VTSPKEDKKLKVLEASYPRITRITYKGKFRYEVFGRRMDKGQYFGQRKRYKTQEEAYRARDLLITTELVDKGSTDIDLNTIAFVQKARERLKCYNVSVEKALDEYIRSREEETKSRLTKDLKTVWEEYLLEHEQKGSSKHTKRTLREMQRKMIAAFGHNIPVGVLAEKKTLDKSENQVVRYFRTKLNGYNQNTKDNIRRYFSAFFGFCFRQGYIEKDENPLRRMMRGKRTRKDPEVLTVDEVEKLLQTAEETDKGIVAIFALKIFGGLRPVEANLITAEDIDWQNGEILIKKHISKTRRSRTYDLISPLKEWLTAYPEMDKVNLRKRFEQLRIKAGFSISKEDRSGKRWASDVCRHTAITMRLAREKYAYGYCAALFGNSEQVIKDHYQSFARPRQEEIDKFYAILPKGNSQTENSKIDVK